MLSCIPCIIIRLEAMIKIGTRLIPDRYNHKALMKTLDGGDFKKGVTTAY